MIPGHTEIDNTQEVEYSPKTFNPFDTQNIRYAEKNLRKVYIERENVGEGSSEEHSLTLGSSETERGSSEKEQTTSGQSSDLESHDEDEQEEVPKAKKTKKNKK